jgi:benzylsuccinate CoA-transferase BbsF subunit
MKIDFLRGIRFADLTWAGAGPFSTKIFADCGAEVIKVESATRADPVRLGGPFRDGIPGLNRSGYFASRNTGKRSLALNLKSGEGREIVRELIRTADVVSNNFGPGAMERLGLDYESVRAIRPDVIYLSMPMYGEDGPLSNLLGVGMTISAVTGLMSLTGYHDGPPLGPGTHFPDHAANPYHAAFAVLAALRHRRRTGRGMKIDLAQVESTINCVGPAVVQHAVTGQEPERLGNRSATQAPHNVFRCRGEDRWCAITVLDDTQWKTLAGIIGLNDPRFATAQGRLVHVDAVEAAVTNWTAQQEAEAVMTQLQQAGVPAGVVADPRSLMENDRQLRHRGYWQRLDHPELKEATYTSPPFRVDGERVELSRPPLIGEHTDEVLGGILGYDAARIAALRALGTIEA